MGKKRKASMSAYDRGATKKKTPTHHPTPQTKKDQPTKNKKNQKNPKEKPKKKKKKTPQKTTTPKPNPKKTPQTKKTKNNPPNPKHPLSRGRSLKDSWNHSSFYLVITQSENKVSHTQI